MDPDRFARLREVVDGALALPAGARSAYVRESYADDPALVREALTLLGYETTGGGDITRVLAGQVRRAASNALGEDTLPDTIGDYRIVEKIGEGGMGVVYRAEQTGALERSVALKLIRAGWNSQRVVARFESERLALARMDHPNIARVFDAGSTADGRPWFVMELVDGQPITAWCDGQLSDTRARLALFCAVCRGVQHAHQKGIIHRDLKPSNVLVTADTGGPAVKIIDFGIAKALTVALDGTADMTLVGQVLGSPDYMSPERMEGEGGDVDIRSDVYSLGVLLYELLSGALPFDRSSRRSPAFGSGTADATRLDPPSLTAKPRTDRETVARIARSRRTDPTALRRMLRGELDWVVAKALAPDREQRYATAREFMQDVERYLAGEPVEAGRPGMAYRLGKVLRRHRVAIAVTATVVASLTFGLIESQRQRLRADAARNEAETVTAFLSDMLSSVRPDEQGRDVTVRRVLDQAAADLGDEFAADPLVRARLQSTIGLAYNALGETDEAIAQQEAVVATRRRELGDRAPATLQAICDLGEALSRAGRFERSGELYREALAGFRRGGGDRVAGVCDAMNGLANALSDQGRFAEAEPYYLEALELLGEQEGDHATLTTSLMNNLALLWADQGRMAEARDMLAEVLALRQQALGEDAPKTMESVLNLAGAESQLGHMAEAVAALEPLVPRARRAMGDEHRLTLAALNNLAWAYARTGRLEEATALTGETLETRRRVLGDEHIETLIAAHNMADMHRRQGKLAEAEALHRRTLAIRQRVLGADHPHTLISREGLAEVLREQGRGADAAAVLSPTGGG
jgi:non-specific serine/threonine protein kinase/serine/threonine-protein kinase